MDKASVTWYMTRMFVLVNIQHRQKRGDQQANVCIFNSFKEDFRVLVQGLSSVSFNDFLCGLQHLYIREKYTFNILRKHVWNKAHETYEAWGNTLQFTMEFFQQPAMGERVWR